MDIKVVDLTGSEIAELLQEHLQSRAQHPPPESIHALDIEGLRKPEITFWSVWSDSELLGYGALKELTAQPGEIKSMRAATLHQRKGVAAKVLKHLLEEAEHRKYKRASLEIGSMDAFVPARTLYARFGFKKCRPFSDEVNFFQDRQRRGHYHCVTIEC